MSAIRLYGSRVGWSLAALILLVGILVAASRWTRSAADPLAPARTAYANREWERALDLARRRMKFTPGDPDVLRLYARAQARLNRDETASGIYKDRLGPDEMEPEDHFLLGLTLVRANKPELAVQVWQQAMKTGPDHAEMLDHLTRLCFRLQRLDESAEAARRLVTQPGWEARGSLLLGEVEGMVENPAGAVDAVRRGLEYDPTARGLPFDLTHYQRLLAHSLLSLGRPAEAEQPLAAILAGGRGSSGETDPEANWLLSRVFLQQGRIADASAALARAGAYRSDNPLAPEPSPYVGASQCTECHRDEEREYRLTRHFRTFHHGADLLKLPIPAHPLPDPDDPEIIHTFERDADKIQLKTRTGDRVYKMVVEYAFGTRERYITMIGRDDHGDFRAFRLSHYHDKNESGWIRTFGSPSDDELVRGQAIPARDGVNRCLYCHVTQPRDYRDPPPESGPTPAVADAGIGCERCHGPGANHIAAIKYDFHDRAIVNAGASTAANINTQCAECHIVGLPSEIGQEPDNPRYVRSSAATMPFSRCYNESGGRLSCLTCHDPHTDSEKSPAYYESRCLKCHSQASTLASTDAGAVAPRSNPVPARATTCPVNPTKNCLECHMPKIDVPVLKTRMTDHFIRIRDRK